MRRYYQNQSSRSRRRGKQAYHAIEVYVADPQNTGEEDCNGG